MIIESIISTLNSNDGRVNFAPMGIHIHDHLYNPALVEEFELHLYKGSQTFSNLYSASEGVINLTDDVLAFVETALFSRELPVSPSKMVSAPRMAGANTVLEFSVISFDRGREPARVKGKLLYHAVFGGFEGFRRAQSAVLEIAIMATRLDHIPLSEIKQHLGIHEQIILKTGGIKEKQALKRVKDYYFGKGIVFPGS